MSLLPGHCLEQAEELICKNIAHIHVQSVIWVPEYVPTRMDGSQGNTE